MALRLVGQLDLIVFLLQISDLVMESMDSQFFLL